MLPDRCADLKDGPITLQPSNVISERMSAKPTQICTPHYEQGKKVIPSERVPTWVCLFLHGWSLPRCQGANLGVFDLRHLTY